MPALLADIRLQSSSQPCHEHLWRLKPNGHQRTGAQAASTRTGGRRAAAAVGGAGGGCCCTAGAAGATHQCKGASRRSMIWPCCGCQAKNFSDLWQLLLWRRWCGWCQRSMPGSRLGACDVGPGQAGGVCLIANIILNCAVAVLSRWCGWCRGSMHGSRRAAYDLPLLWLLAKCRVTAVIYGSCCCCAAGGAGAQNQCTGASRRAVMRCCKRHSLLLLK